MRDDGPPKAAGKGAPPAHARRKAELSAKMVRANRVQPLLATRYLVKGWFDRGAMSVVYGESNVGKTFFALSLADHVSRGYPWAGCRVARGPVFYLASEGGSSFVNRIAALSEPSEHLVVIPAVVDLCGSSLDAEALSALIAEEAKAHGEPALLVVDTLGRAMGKGDENGPADMGAFVRNVDLIRARTSAHVMVIHHSGKDRARGARGHSSLRAATDSEIELTAENGIIIAEAKKQRDMAGGRRFAYRLVEVELGRDQDGDPVTSCRVERCDAPTKEGKSGPLSDLQKITLEALRQFTDDHGAPNPAGTGWPEPGRVRMVPEDDFRRFASAKQHHDNARDRARAVRRSIEALQARGLVQTNEGQIWATR